MNIFKTIYDCQFLLQQVNCLLKNQTLVIQTGVPLSVLLVGTCFCIGGLRREKYLRDFIRLSEENYHLLET